MADTGIYITVDGTKQLVSKLEGISSRGKNLKPWLMKAASITILGLKDNFSSNGARLNKPWEPRKDSHTWPLLFKTGKMKMSFIANVDTKKAVINNSDPKFKFHQLGTSRMTDRNMLGISYQDSLEITQWLRNYLTKGS